MDPTLSVGKKREQASIELYRPHLDDLLTKRDNLRTLSEIRGPSFGPHGIACT